MALIAAPRLASLFESANQMRFGSVCSGIEAASVAWHPLGWRAAWLAEIEPFPSAVLAHHYPDVPNLGDMTHLPEQIVMGEIEAPDLFCGGTPCQAFSVAGLRKSLDDARGNLSLTFCEIANAIDLSRTHDNLEPCIVFWENVPGVLNTKDNAFGCFLAGLAGEDEALTPPGGKWANAGVVFGPQRAVAWRVLDAQYFGVAQRRRRVFVVASARDGFDPAAVLFEFDGVRRDSAPSREAREGTTAGTGSGAAFGGNNTGGPIDVATARNACSSASGRMDFESETFLVQPVIAFHADAQVDQMRFDETTSASLTCSQKAAVAFSIMPMNSGKDYKARETDIAQPIMAGGPVGGNQGGDFIAQPVAFHPTQDPISSTDGTAHCMGTGSSQGNATIAVAFHENQRTEVTLNDTTGALNSGGGKPGQGYPAVMAVAFAQNQLGEVRTGDVFNTINTNSNASGRNTPLLQAAMQARRLTPRECERLQGFPDDYTLIPYRGKPAADGPRYKALGNSWAVPVVRWIGWRIAAQVWGALA